MVNLVRRELRSGAVLIASIERGQHVADFHGTAVVQIGTSAPEFVEVRHHITAGVVGRVIGFVQGADAVFVGAAIIIIWQVTIDAAGVRTFKNRFSLHGIGCEFSVYQVRTRFRRQGAHEGINVVVVRLRMCLELDEFVAGLDADHGVGADAGPHRRRRLWRIDVRFGVLGVAEAVVHQIPIHAVSARAGMTTIAGKPALVTAVGVEVKPLAASR